MEPRNQENALPTVQNVEQNNEDDRGSVERDSVLEAYGAQTSIIQDLQGKLREVTAKYEALFKISGREKDDPSEYDDYGNSGTRPRLPLPLRDVPMFTGDLSTTEDGTFINVHRFVRRIEEATNSRHWKDWQRLTLAKGKMKGLAAKALDREDWLEITTWPAFKTKMIEEYKEQVSLNHCFALANTIKRKSRETFRALLRRVSATVDDMCYEAGFVKQWRTVLIWQAMKNNLPERCQARLNMQKPLQQSVFDIEEFLETEPDMKLTLRHIAEEKTETSPAKPKGTANKVFESVTSVASVQQQRDGSAKKFCKHCKKSDHATLECDDLLEKLNQVIKPSSTPSSLTTTNQRPGKITKRTGNRSGASCYHCGRRGHLAKFCKQRKGPRCYLCDKDGHITKACPELPKNGQAPPSAAPSQ